MSCDVLFICLCIRKGDRAMVSPPDFFHHCNPAYRVLPGDQQYACKGITQSHFLMVMTMTSVIYRRENLPLWQRVAITTEPRDGTGRQALPPDRACKESADKVLIVDDPQRFDIALLLNDQRRI